jgi:pimeloyl-ACP methyl ester carboxylesterase
MTLKEQVVDVQGRHVTVQRAPGDGPSVILVHGASGTGATWAPVLAHLSWADVLVVDLPGRGGSPGPAASSVEEAAGWLGAVIDAAGVHDPIVVGHSYGGAIALTVALARPGRQRLALVGSGSKLKVAPPILELVKQTSPSSPLRFDFAFAPGTDDAILTAYHAGAAGLETASALNDWRACDTFDVRDRLGDVEDPCLVLWGAQDALTPPHRQRMLVDALPDAHAVELEGVAHFLPWEAPSAFADALRTFANDTAP